MKRHHLCLYKPLDSPVCFLRRQYTCCLFSNEPVERLELLRLGHSEGDVERISPCADHDARNDSNMHNSWFWIANNTLSMRITSAENDYEKVAEVVNSLVSLEQIEVRIM